MALYARDISEVRMHKVVLIKHLKENRDNHRGLFEEAMEAYRKKAIEELEKHIERIKSGAPEKVHVSLPLPEDHTEDYNRVIAMLEHGLDDEVILSEHDYSQYVQDNWGWVASFEGSYAMYTGKSL